MKIITETKRLIIREIFPTDVDAMFELHSDPEVHRYLGNKTISSKEKMMEIIIWLTRQYNDFGVGRWAMILKETEEFVGWTGLEFVTHAMNNHINYYDLGYRLNKKFWGRGIATESAVASLDYAFTKLKANEVYGMADCDNTGSNKILANIGLRFIETFDYEGVRHNWYKIDKAEYEQNL